MNKGNDEAITYEEKEEEEEQVEVPNKPSVKRQSAGHQQQPQEGVLERLDNFDVAVSWTLVLLQFLSLKHKRWSCSLWEENA